MKITLDARRSLHENAAAYYEEAKKWKSKADGVKKAMLETKKKIEKAKKIKLVEKKVRVKEFKKKEWFEKYHFFFTTDGFLVIAGKDAKQNDLLGSKHLDENDYFYHADITGAAATILKTDGRTPKQLDELEAAQWAACYSRAWKQKYHSVDVYRVLGSQTSKQSQGEYVGKGGYMIHGERTWFRNTELKISIGKENGKLVAKPAIHSKKPAGAILTPGDTPKNAVAKQLAKKLDAVEDELMQLIPGDCEVA